MILVVSSISVLRIMAVNHQFTCVLLEYLLARMTLRMNVCVHIIILSCVAAIMILSCIFILTY